MTNSKRLDLEFANLGGSPQFVIPGVPWRFLSTVPERHLKQRQQQRLVQKC